MKVDKVDLEAFETLAKENRRLCDEVNKWRPLGEIALVITAERHKLMEMFDELRKDDKQIEELTIKCARLETEIQDLKKPAASGHSWSGRQE